jgi:hypothetical protein
MIGFDSELAKEVRGAAINAGEGADTTVGGDKGGGASGRLPRSGGWDTLKLKRVSFSIEE